LGLVLMVLDLNHGDQIRGVIQRFDHETAADVG
jgi:hypothetical protein